MNTLQKTLTALTLGSFMSVGAQAAVSYGNGMTAEPYIGAKIGQYDADGADDAALSYGIYGGAKFTPYFGIEAEYLGTSTEDIGETATTEAEYDAQVYGLYATYDYPFANTGGLYAKGRLGFAKNEIDIDSKIKNTSVSSSDSIDDSGIAGGIGLGYDISPNAAVELTYDWYPTVEDNIGNQEYDVDASGVTLGAKFKF